MNRAVRRSVVIAVLRKRWVVVAGLGSAIVLYVRGVDWLLDRLVQDRLSWPSD